VPPGQPFPPERFETNVHPDDRRVLAIIESARRSSASEGWDLEYRRVGPDGRVTWHQSIARASRDAAGRVIRISGISLDITRRKETEAAAASRQQASTTPASSSTPESSD